MPALDEVLGHGVATVRHVPRLARAAWSQCLARALAATHSRNTVQAWVELLMLARCALVAPSRGGARHRQQAALATKRRCQRWLDGERVELWEELAEQRPQRSATAGGERSLAAR